MTKSRHLAAGIGDGTEGNGTGDEGRGIYDKRTSTLGAKLVANVHQTALPPFKR